MSRLDLLDHWPREQAKSWVYHFAGAACAADGTRALVVVGSLVRPVQSAADVDLVYIYTGQPISTAHHPLDVDIRSYAATDVPRLLETGHDLLGWSLRLGYLLCERDDYWSHLRSAWLPYLAMPDPEVAEARARQAERYYRDLLELGDSEAAREQLVSALTHQARARLSRAGVYPTSRPELIEQLRSIGVRDLAKALDEAVLGNSLELPDVGISLPYGLARS